LLYAQVVKQRDKGRGVEVGTQVIFGDPQAIAACLAVSRNQRDQPCQTTNHVMKDRKQF
jgi:hypothetical protein